VGRSFVCEYNNLKNWTGKPKYMGDQIYLAGNPLEKYPGYFDGITTRTLSEVQELLAR
jgi:hypothetical protein